MKKVFTLCSLVLFIFLLSSCQSESTTGESVNLEKVRIGVSKSPLSAPFFIAQEMGFFESEGLDVTMNICLGGNRCFSEMLEGKHELATATEYVAMIRGFERDDFSIYSTFVTSTDDVRIITAKDRGITVPEDLSGKKVGVTPGTSVDYYLGAFLLDNGLGLNDIERIELNPEDMLQALENKEVDAFATWEPFVFEAKEIIGENSVILPNNLVYRETFNLMGLNDQYNKGTMVKLLTALKKAEEYINTEPVISQEIITQVFGFDEKFIEWVWEDFQYGLSLDQALLLTMEDQALWAIENSLVDGENPNYLHYINAEALSEVSKEDISLIG